MSTPNPNAPIHCAQYRCTLSVRACVQRHRMPPAPGPYPGSPYTGRDDPWRICRECKWGAQRMAKLEAAGLLPEPPVRPRSREERARGVMLREQAERLG
jgi:hypothetical protein